MGRNDDGFPHPLQLLKDGHHFNAGPRIETAGGFVQQQKRGIVNQHPGEPRRCCMPRLSAPMSAPFLAEADQFQHVCHRPPRWAAGIL